MTSPFDENSGVRIAHGYRFQWEEAQKCHVMLYPEGMIKLNDSASEILSRIDDSSTVNSIVNALKSAFPDADLEQDVLDFLEQARDNGWIDLG